MNWMRRLDDEADQEEECAHKPRCSVPCRRDATRVERVKTGATRSRKTWRLTSCCRRGCWGHGKPGLNLLMGSTRGTLQRNLIEPLQAYVWPAHDQRHQWGRHRKAAGGRARTALGRTACGRWTGCGDVKYCYGDEVTWHRDVFGNAQKQGWTRHATGPTACNPKGPPAGSRVPGSGRGTIARWATWRQSADRGRWVARMKARLCEHRLC